MLRQGLYEQVINKELKLALSMLDKEKFEIGMESMNTEEASKKLANYITEVTRRALTMIRDEKKDNESLVKQIKICNDIIQHLSKTLDERTFKDLEIEEEGEVLTSLYEKINTARSFNKSNVIRPITSLSETSLFTGSKSEPNMVNELKKEILSADNIQFLISFIKWNGLRLIYEELKQFTEKGGQLHIISTSYMGATDYKAIVELSKLPNTTIKLSYNVKVTRLHAKAYIFKRNTHFSTAYIGSSNLSNPALTSGLEWNLKITERESIDVMKKVSATFDSYWSDEEFIHFDPSKEQDHLKLKESLTPYQVYEKRTALFDIRPFPYQQEVLDKLQAERDVHQRYKNLIVAATGVGKTVISAFDYKRFLQKHGKPATILFVAHRKEILEQALETYRHILKDFNFGELLFGGKNPSSIEHLFVTIDSLNSRELFQQTTSDFYDYIVIDEFHHAAAKSYQKVLEYYTPKILVGLTATPERMDGRSIIDYFDGHIATEIRLTEAIDRKLLSPFQYFGITDTVDLSKIKFSRRGYDLQELENVYTHNTKRVQQIVNSVYKYITSIDTVKGLGFCVSIEHAKYMAKMFNEYGIASISLDGTTDQDTRDSAKSLLQKGDIKFIFVVDLYNEGVDIPEVNTILFLRPTESLTVFLQQLGRGLRLHDEKECLTVLDFIGQAHKNYQFEHKFRSLIGRSRHTIKHYIENGFSNLPRGSFIQLERQAKEYVLRNIKSLTNSKPNLIMKLKNFKQDTNQPLTLMNFLEYYQMTPYDFYGRTGNRSFYRLLVEAGLTKDFQYENEKAITKRLPYLLHLNSVRLLKFYLSFLEDRKINNDEEKLMVHMLYYTLYLKDPKSLGFQSIMEGINKVLDSTEMKEEILQILTYNYHHVELVEKSLPLPFATPLRVHATYTTDQIFAALGYYEENQRPEFREGVKHLAEKKIDVFFITLNKSDKDFSSSTMYEDYAINEKLFHWQSQSRTSLQSETAQRYIHHKERNHKILLFVREYKVLNGYASPFTFLGTADYVSHTGNKPISFVWELQEKIPGKLIAQANKHIL